MLSLLRKASGHHTGFLCLEADPASILPFGLLLSKLLLSTDLTALDVFITLSSGRAPLPSAGASRE